MKINYLKYQVNEDFVDIDNDVDASDDDLMLDIQNNFVRNNIIDFLKNNYIISSLGFIPGNTSREKYIYASANGIKLEDTDWEPYILIEKNNDINSEYPYIVSFDISDIYTLNIHASADIKELSNGIFVFKHANVFNCSGCDSLTTLKGAPISVDYLYCERCENLISLEGCPLVKVSFSCEECPSLKSLTGFKYDYTNVKSIESNNIIHNFSCADCISLKTLHGCPPFVDTLVCSGCLSLISFAGGPLEVNHLAACDLPNLTSKRGITARYINKHAKINEDFDDLDADDDISDQELSNNIKNIYLKSTIIPFIDEYYNVYIISSQSQYEDWRDVIEIIENPAGSKYPFTVSFGDSNRYTSLSVKKEKANSIKRLTNDAFKFLYIDNVYLQECVNLESIEGVDKVNVIEINECNSLVDLTGCPIIMDSCGIISCKSLKSLNGFSYDHSNMLRMYNSFDLQIDKCKSLESLVGCPERVANFYCTGNTKLSSFKGCPKIIKFCSDFTGCYNITSLEGSPYKSPVEADVDLAQFGRYHGKVLITPEDFVTANISRKEFNRERSRRKREFRRLKNKE